MATVAMAGPGNKQNPRRDRGSSFVIFIYLPTTRQVS